MNTSELKKRLYTLIESVESREALNQFYTYLKSLSVREISRLWERFYSVYSYRKLPEEGSIDQELDFVSHTEKRIKQFLH